MIEFRIDPARPDDRRTLAELYAEDMNNLGIDHRADALLPLVDETLKGQESAFVTFVARTDQDPPQVAGVLLANPFWSLKVAGRALWIEELFVRPDFRRCGIGRQLVDHLLDWAEDNGFKGVELEAYTMNTAASVLYRVLGFQRLARERYCFYFDEE
jgi:GNAT superfamily N-acetyltransferase